MTTKDQASALLADLRREPGDDPAVRAIRDELARDFEVVEVYRSNPASIAVRVTDGRFARLGKRARDDLTSEVLDRLPADVQAEITRVVEREPGSGWRAVDQDLD